MNKQFNILDAMSVISFMIGLANYSENVNQTDIQDMITKIVKDIHAHLERQDEKIDRILELLEGGEQT